MTTERPPLADRSRPTGHGAPIGGVKRVLVAGAYGWRHVGDDAILEANIRAMRHAAPAVDIVAFTYAPAETAGRHDVRTAPGPETVLTRLPCVGNAARASAIILPVLFFTRFLLLWWNARRLRRGKRTRFLSAEAQALLQTIRWADLLLSVGGGYLTSQWRYTELYAKSCAYVLAAALGTKVLLSGQSIGPLTTPFDRRFVGWALNHADVIVLRDADRSARLLHRIGVRRPTIVESVDDALATPAADRGAVEACLARAGIAPTRPWIVATLHQWPGLGDAHRRLPALLDEVVDTTGAQVVLLPMKFTPPDDDVVTLHGIRQQMRRRDAARVLEGPLSDALAVGIIARSRLAIASRYHLAVFALANGVPCLSIFAGRYYQNKLRSIHAQFAQEHFAVDAARDVAEVLPRLRELIEQSAAVAAGLAHQAARLRAVALPCVRYVRYSAATQGAVEARTIGAAFESWRVPRRLARGSTAVGVVTLRNTGALPWQYGVPAGAPRVTIGYHWRAADGNVVTWESSRPAVPRTVYPQEHVTLEVPIRAPDRRGPAIFEWDLCVEHVAWLTSLGVETPTLPVEIV